MLLEEVGMEADVMNESIAMSSVHRRCSKLVLVGCLSVLRTAFGFGRGGSRLLFSSALLG